MRAMISVVVQVILSNIFGMRDKQRNHTVIGLFSKSFPIYFIFLALPEIYLSFEKQKQNKTQSSAFTK